MAANDYYSNHPQGQQATSSPYQSQDQHGNNPSGNFASPFSDANAYNSTSSFSPSINNQHQADTAYHSGYDPRNNNNNNKPSDPFADSANNIALSDHPQHGYYGGQSQYPPGTIGPDALPVHQKSKKKHKNVPFYRNTHWPWVCYILSAIQLGVFIGEIIRNTSLTKSPIEVKPNFNIMIGPSPFVLINMGARYLPCITEVKIDNIIWACPNATSLEISANGCSLATLCGMGAKQGEQPYQWWRYITPMFLHAGIIHLGLNMAVQLLLGAQMEREIGSLRFFVVYFASGIMGFVLGANFAPQGLASTGASGALAGIIALVLIDLFYTWRERQHPMRDLIWLLIDLAIAFVIGLLPGVDNMAHIGGFLMGVVLGPAVLHSPPALRMRIGEADPTYATVTNPSGIAGFAKSPVGFFKGRKPLWWGWWLVRAGLLVLAFVCTIVLIKNVYSPNKTECKWCKHLTCLPISNWCSLGQLSPNSR